MSISNGFSWENGWLPVDFPLNLLSGFSYWQIHYDWGIIGSYICGWGSTPSNSKLDLPNIRRK